MALCREIDDRIDLMFMYRGIDLFGIADIPLHKGESWGVEQIFEVVRVSGVCQLVVNNSIVIRVFI